MLVLTRSVGERLIIGNGEVSVHVLEVRGSQVRIGIEAPKHIPVHREEIYQRITATGASVQKNAQKIKEETTVSS